MTDTVSTQRHGPVLVVAMNRPAARNALSRDMSSALTSAWDQIDNDDGIRAAVITGTRDCFCAGGDLMEMGELHRDTSDPRPFVERAAFMLDATLRSRRLAKPLIAAVEGPALAGGMEMLLATDIRIAGSSARFGLPEVTLGLVPVSGSTVRLPTQVPFARAMDLLLTGRTFDTAEALQIGLISRVVPDGTALDEALRIAARIAANGPLAVSAIRQSAWESRGLAEPDGLQLEMATGAPVWNSRDAIEGIAAFAAKRAPSFTGA